MSQNDFQRIRSLFETLADLTPAQRDEFLAAQSDLGAATQRQLRELLQVDEQLAGMTVRSAVDTACHLANSALPRSGLRIGAYQLQRELGSGGMGSVYLAERSDDGIAHQVAIKIVHPELLDASTLARFRLERQVLALLRHPHIATMLDLGELDDGSPYAVMQFVDGVPITEYARSRGLNLKQRLQLLLQVCDAVAYAHRNMIVHRDLKPSNVLVDQDGHPKLLDFGIAKPLVGHLGAIDVEQTATAQRLFSPSHAAPEQLKGEVITTACDVYGLGTLLYELLADQPPFSAQDRTPGQLEREICEVDPMPPGRRRAAGSASSVGAVPRDLDLITLRCLRKQPSDRYSSVEALADDLQRYLAGRPVAARRGNLLYRSGRFIARHRVAVTLSAVIAAVTLAGSLLLTRQSLATAEQRSRADEMTGLIIDALRSVDPSQKGERGLTAQDVFERVASQAQAKPDLSPQSRTRLLDAIARINLELGLPKQAEALLEQLDPDTLSADERDQAGLTKTRVLLIMRRLEEAKALIAAGLARAGSAKQKAQWQIASANLDEGLGQQEDALQKLDAIPAQGLDAETRENRSSTRARVLMDLGRNEAALEEFTGLLAAQRARLGHNSPAVFEIVTEMVYVQIRLGNHDKAAELSKEQFALADSLFGRNSVRYSRALSSAQYVERSRGNYLKAIEYELAVQAISREQYGEVSAQVAKSHFNLAGMYENLENFAEADNYFRKAIAMGQRVWLPSHMNNLLFRTAFAVHLAVNDNRPAEAQEQARAALRDAQADPKLVQSDLYSLAKAIDALGDYAAQPSAANKSALAKALGIALTAGSSRAYKKAADTLAATVKKNLGVEAEPAAKDQ